MIRATYATVEQNKTIARKTEDSCVSQFKSAPAQTAAKLAPTCFHRAHWGVKVLPTSIGAATDSLDRLYAPFCPANTDLLIYA